MRRIITGHNGNGKSIITLDGPPARSIGEDVGGLFALWNTDGNEVISTGTTRGFAQYDVTDSEIVNEDTKKSMTKIATKNAIQLMTSRIQSSISR